MSYINLGLIGYPLSHTLSPMLHTHFLSVAGLNGGYTCYEVKANDELSSLINILRHYSFTGVNVTVPYKTEIMKYCDIIDPAAERVGAVNTLHFYNGKIHGFNTDVYGFGRMLEEECVLLDNKNILVLGAGGAARAVAEYISNFNAKSITIANRTLDKAESLAKSIGIKPNIINIENISKLSYDVIINTTSIGLKGEPFPFVATPYEVAVDLQYKPTTTSFLSLYQQSAVKKINGFSMLVWQAFRSFTIWTGEAPNIDITKLYDQFLKK